ncbi:MAG: hypothetical protein R3F14_23060 [Polyangiaceae bacterium]
MTGEPTVATDGRDGDGRRIEHGGQDAHGDALRTLAEQIGDREHHAVFSGLVRRERRDRAVRAGQGRPAPAGEETTCQA